MWSNISAPEAFAQASGAIELVLAVLLWHHRAMRRGWGLGWLALSMACASIVNLAAPWTVTPLLTQRHEILQVRPVLLGVVLAVGFASLASLVSGLRAYVQVEGWRAQWVFIVLWLLTPMLVVALTVLGVPLPGDWITLLLMGYCARLVWQARQAEPGVGHAALALVLVLYPLILLAMGFTSLEITTVRYLVALPYTVIGVMLLSVTLNRLRLERERAQEQLRELNVELEERVHERTLELEARNADLAQSLLALEQTRAELQTTLTGLQSAQDRLVQSEKLAVLGGLVAGVAHELNTPLGNALTSASAMHDGARAMVRTQAEGTLRRSQLQEFLDHCVSGGELVVRNISRAANLVESFKRVAVDQSRLQRCQFHLHSVVADTMAMVSPAFTRLPVTVVQAVPESLVLDSCPGPLEQVLTNLVQNAVVHGLGQRHALQIAIRAHPALREGVDGVELVCEDDGEGMTEQVVRHAFDPYFTTRFGQGGSGLGLYIVYNLVHSALGGTIEIDSAPGRGASVRLWLPLQGPSSQLHAAH